MHASQAAMRVARIGRGASLSRRAFIARTSVRNRANEAGDRAGRGGELSAELWTPLLAGAAGIWPLALVLGHQSTCITCTGILVMAGPARRH